MSDGNEERSGSTLGSQCAQRLFDRQQIPQRQRIGAIESSLGLTYQQARRRMNGETDWSLEELQTLAETYGETLQSLVSVVPIGELPEAAVLAIGGANLPCEVWLGQASKLAGAGTGADTLVATRGEDQRWRIVYAAEALQAEVYQVTRVVIRPSAPKRHRVAVLDDDRDLALSIAEYLRHVGYDATAFYSLERLSQAIEVQQYEAYVIDWLVDKKNARSLVAQIRAKSVACAIIVLTGQLRSGDVEESELTLAATTFRLQYLEKPLRNSIISSALDRLLERQAPA